jgi:hypothetical protein
LQPDFGAEIVYNHDSFRGAPKEAEAEPWADSDGTARAAALLRAIGVDLADRGAAFFDPREDALSIPRASSFERTSAWAATAMHEVLHWTGHPERLGRFVPAQTTPEDYAFEELVAELGSAMITARLRIDATRIEDEQHRAYLTIWASRIKERPEALYDALRLADQAAGFLEALAPGVFDPEVAPAPVSSAAQAPRTLHDGGLWRGDVRRYISPFQPPTDDRLKDVPHAAMAPRPPRSRAKVPAVWIVGFPGDGAESFRSTLHHRLRNAEVRVARTPPEDGNGTVIDLRTSPLPAEVASCHLAKTDERPWIAVAHRRRTTVRLLEAWANRLRAEWFDGTKRPRAALRRLTFAQTAPFAPIVLHQAQAVLDAMAGTDRAAPSLGALVRTAMVQRPARAASDLVPLDVLLAPLASHRPSALEERVRLVVCALELCPELSRGTRSVAVALLRSVDEDLEELEAQIQACSGSNGARRVGSAWHCRDPL